MEYPIKEIAQLGIASYVNHDIVILLNYWDPMTKWEQLQKDCFACHEILVKQDINQWNAYFVICADDHVTLEECFLIERDASFLRKYVIRNEDDLCRVPFLDNTTVQDVSINRGYLDTDDQMIQEVLKIFETENGFDKELKNDGLQKALNVVMPLGGERNET